MFIIYDIDNRSLDDLIKLKFLKKISFIKSKHLLMSKTAPAIGSGSSSALLRTLYGKGSLVGGGSPIYSISSAAAAAVALNNYTDDEMRKFASLAFEKFNQSVTTSLLSSTSVASSSYSIFLFIFVVLVLTAFVVLCGFRVITVMANKRRQKSSLNALISRLSQASASKLAAQQNDEKTNSTATKAVEATANGVSSFKTLLKDFSSFKSRHFTISFPRFFSLPSRNTSKQQQKSSSSSVSSSTSSSCTSSQFKQLSENKYSSVSLIIENFYYQILLIYV